MKFLQVAEELDKMSSRSSWDAASMAALAARLAFQADNASRLAFGSLAEAMRSAADPVRREWWAETAEAYQAKAEGFSADATRKIRVALKMLREVPAV